MAQQHENLLVVSSYPPEGATHHKSVVGVATYTKNTLLALKSHVNGTITVLAEKLPGYGNYREDNIVVKRVWRRNNPLSYLTLLKKIWLDKSKNILIELEIAMFGGKFMLLLLPFFILLCRLSGKRTTIVIHQVIADITEMSGHIYTYNKGIKSWTMNMQMKIFYFLVCLFATNVIVFDEFLKQRLPLQKNVTVIPHGVESFKEVANHDAKQKLHIAPDTLVVLYFGFIAWYKGPDRILDALDKLKTNGKQIKLIIAGGPNPNHVDKPSYMSYVHKIEQQAEQLGATVTGFVNETDIPRYFGAADVVVFPYRTLMSASGPLSMAFSFSKPFLVSAEMDAIFETEDIKQLLVKYQINKSSLEFSSTDDLSQKLLKPAVSKQFLADIKTKRSWHVIGKAYYDAIFSNNS